MSELENILKTGEQAAPVAVGVFGMIKSFFRKDAKPEAALILDTKDIVIGCLLAAVLCLTVALIMQSMKSPLIVRL